jgi:hypothetical protein
LAKFAGWKSLKLKAGFPEIEKKKTPNVDVSEYILGMGDLTGSWLYGSGSIGFLGSSRTTNQFFVKIFPISEPAEEPWDKAFFTFSPVLAYEDSELPSQEDSFHFDFYLEKDHFNVIKDRIVQNEKSVMDIAIDSKYIPGLYNGLTPLPALEPPEFKVLRSHDDLEDSPEDIPSYITCTGRVSYVNEPFELQVTSGSPSTKDGDIEEEQPMGFLPRWWQETKEELYEASGKQILKQVLFLVIVILVIRSCS